MTPLAADIRTDHLHHGDGEGDLEVVEALVEAVGDRAIGEDRGKAAPAGLEQVLGAAHIEEAFVLAGKACGRQIFRRRRTSHRDGDAGPGFPLKLPISFHDLFAEKRRVHRPVYDLAGFGGFARKHA